MGEKIVLKAENCINLDDLLQCPVCYEIPAGQIFQCNEGHHVCGRCKVRLDVCPVCRALFFGTRNYAMEELIANFRKKSGGKVSAASSSSNSSTIAPEAISVEQENEVVEETNDNNLREEPLRPPLPCKGLFRCLCCKVGKAERLPIARLLNHLRYFHAPDLIEGRSENGEYVQAWQFPTVRGRLVTAVRVADMGIFFLIIEIKFYTINAWLTMASSPWVAQAYSYTITLSGFDREAIFTDCVWSVRSCEGTLKKRGHCLSVTGDEALPLLSPAALSGKLAVRRTPDDQLTVQPQPRAIMRVANRGTDTITRQPHMEPFFRDDENSVTRNYDLIVADDSTQARSDSQARDRVSSRSEGQATVEDEALARSELQVRDTNAANVNNTDRTTSTDRTTAQTASTHAPVENGQPAAQGMSRNARRRMRQRLRAAMEETLVQHANDLQVIEDNLRLLPLLSNLNGQLINVQNVNGSPAEQSTGTTNSRSARRKRRQRR